MTLKTSGSGAASFTALVFDPAQELAEVGAGSQGGDHYRAVFVGCDGGHELSISIN
jgi:hypothetical protein